MLETNPFERWLRLIDLEAEAEKQETLRAMQRGAQGADSLLGLVIRDQDTGMGGRVLLTFGKKNQTLALPWTRLGVGTPVILSTAGNEFAGSWRGIVSRLQRETIQVAFVDWPEIDGDRPLFRLDRSTDEISRQRQREGLEKARSAESTRLAGLRDILLGQQPPAFKKQPAVIGAESLTNASLNAAQREAVCFALAAEDIAVIHGPPGTGKTTTLVELIHQIVRGGERVLVVAPSNLAVDNLLERLIVTGDAQRAVRLGHPARVMPELRAHTLDELVEKDTDVRLAQRMLRDAAGLRDHASKFTRARPEPGARQAQRREARLLVAEARKIESQVVERVLDQAVIVCATLTGLDRDILGKRSFDWCIMDEASQSTEPAAWIPLQAAQRLVLAGDPFQLPPTVVSSEAAAQGFNVSMLERLMNLYGDGISRRLGVQYRMHTEIMQFSSEEFYQGSLSADAAVGGRLLRDLPGVASSDLTESAVDFIDTAGANYDEKTEVDGDSRFNPQEADLALRKVHQLLEAGVAAGEIALISPYSAQVRLLRERLTSFDVEVDSVDGFQGREKEAVVVSLVRSNREGEIGFLEDVRRMNVALTRAKRKLIVIGDSATIGAHPFYQRMIAYFERIGAYHSVWEENY